MIAALCLALATAAPAAAAGGAAPVDSAHPERSREAAESKDAQPLGFHARADKATVRLGEPFGYTVEIRHRPEERYALHGEPALAPFRVEGPRCRREEGKGAQGGREARTTCSMRLALFSLGPADVPDLVFDVDTPGGKARLAVPGPRITGQGVIDPQASTDRLQLRDIAPPAPLLVPSYRLLWWALGLLAAAAACVAAVIAVRRARARGRIVPEPTPFERFERRLAALEAERLPQRGRGPEHVARLAECVREYVGALSGLAALDLTTAELLTALRAAPAGAQLDLAGLELFLTDADLVKFARQPAGTERCQAGTEYARSLLERTRPVMPPEQGARAAGA